MNENSNMTITEFLEARIAEDEAGAKAATPGRWFRDSGWSISAPAPEGWDGPYVVVETPRARNDSEFVARHDPARVLTECAAKRAIIEAHPITNDVVEVSTRIKWGFACETCFSYGDMVEDNGYCDTLRALAAVYAGHADYQKEWVP